MVRWAAAGHEASRRTRAVQGHVKGYGLDVPGGVLERDLLRSTGGEPPHGFEKEGS